MSRRASRGAAGASDLEQDERVDHEEDAEEDRPAVEVALDQGAAAEGGHEPEEGYEWIDGDDWRIDWGGAWSRVGVDDQGYVYTDNCWSHPAPYAYGVDTSVPKTPSMTSETEEDELDQMSEDEISGSYRAVTRRRRWLRRAVKVAETKS